MKPFLWKLQILVQSKQWSRSLITCRNWKRGLFIKNMRKSQEKKKAFNWNSTNRVRTNPLASRETCDKPPRQIPQRSLYSRSRKRWPKPLITWSNSRQKHARKFGKGSFQSKWNRPNLMTNHLLDLHETHDKMSRMPLYSTPNPHQRKGWSMSSVAWSTPC